MLANFFEWIPTLIPRFLHEKTVFGSKQHHNELNSKKSRASFSGSISRCYEQEPRSPVDSCSARPRAAASMEDFSLHWLISCCKLETSISLSQQNHTLPQFCHNTAAWQLNGNNPQEHNSGPRKSDSIPPITWNDVYHSSFEPLETADLPFPFIQEKT